MISAVILTFNSIKFIKSCLDSLLPESYRELEVIVVDNGSRDGTLDFIRKNYPQVILIENKNNLGACRGRNQGISIAKGEWILTLDSDVTVEKNFMARVFQEIVTVSSDVGLIQPKILNSDKRTIYSAGIYLSCIRRFYDIGKKRKITRDIKEKRDIFGACCAAALYRRKMLEELKEDSGYFDERFFFLVEDVDLSWRAQRNGWKVKFLPDAQCYHEGNSSGYTDKLRQYLCFRNRYLMIGKNEALLGKIKLFFLSFWYDFPRALYLIVTNKHLRNLL